MEERIKELEQLIPYYAEHYYNGDTLIEDQEFDKLTEELERLKPNSEILNKVGWGSEENSNGKIKVEHIYTEVGSLKKTREFEGLPEQFVNINLNISPKLDGLTAVCYYKNGKLDKAVTRGNGKVGLDITDKLQIILSKYNINLPSDFTGAIRGELEIAKSNWEIIKNNNENASNSRNYAAGIINRNELSEDLKYVDLVTYKILGSENHKFNTKSEIVNFLKTSGFNTIWNIQYTINSKDEWDRYSKELYTQDYEYQLDGLVLSREEIRYNDRSGIEYIEYAYKFKSEYCDVVVKDIEWNLSEKQRLKPVVVFDKTYISGAEVQRATGFNAKYILDNNIKIGSVIRVCRSGEVIPYIMEVINE